MKLTISWLKKYLKTDATPAQIIDGLNQIGLEVEEVVDMGEVYKPFIIAQIIEATPHPEADKLKVCKVNNGKEIIQIVCGAPNARAGIKVVLAPIGAEIPANSLKIKQSKIRNIDSCGMLCSASELSLGEESDGIIELEENYIVGNSFADTKGLNEISVEISVTPNRGDCLGIYGIARDLAAAGFGTLNPLSSINIKGEFSSPINVNLSGNCCPRYIGRYFKNINNVESPSWLQKDLKSIGQKPISSLVDITNYFTFAFGRPLHVYDADLIADIEVRQAFEKEEFVSLNDKSYSLKETDGVITSRNKIIALAGIIGEKSVGVTCNTKNIFLEIGLFDADNITLTARAHQIDSDAKYRFERKIDSEFMELALDLVSEMISQICGGQMSLPVIVDNLKYESRIIKFNLSDLKKLIGIEYKKENVINILHSLGFIIKDEGEILHLTIPSWRHDIALKEDIIEEIARIDGYDKIKSIALPRGDEFGSILNQKQKNLYRISRFAASLGLNEVITWSFMHSKKAALFGNLKDELYLKNPISSELDYMRASILPNLLEVAEKNQNRNINNVQLFEMSSIFKGIKPEDQFLTITGLRSGHNNERNSYGDHRPVDLFDSKADIFNILSEIGLDPTKLQYITNDLPNYYHPGRSAGLALGKNIIGYFGELHPKIIQSYSLNQNAVGFELFLDNLPITKSKMGRKGTMQISDYQMVERDFSFIIDQDISVDYITKLAFQVDKKLIKQVNVFDIYSGKGIDMNKKSIAFTVTLQAFDRTLSDIEIEELCAKVINSITQNTKGALRSA